MQTESKSAMIYQHTAHRETSVVFCFLHIRTCVWEQACEASDGERAGKRGPQAKKDADEICTMAN